MTTPPPFCQTCPHGAPKWQISPSGGGWFHRKGCPKAGQKVRGLAEAKAAHPARGRRRPLVGALARESNVVALPIPVVGEPDTDRCPAHPDQERFECEPCNRLGEGWSK